MSDFVPAVPIALQIRRIIFERFNDPDTNIISDDVFAVLKEGGDVDPSWDVSDAEPFFAGLCDSGPARNIGQNLTTIYLRLFDRLQETECQKCRSKVCIGPSEGSCPNPSCGSPV